MHCIVQKSCKREFKDEISIHRYTEGDVPLMRGNLLPYRRGMTKSVLYTRAARLIVNVLQMIPLKNTAFMLEISVTSNLIIVQYKEVLAPTITARQAHATATAVGEDDVVGAAWYG